MNRKHHDIQPQHGSSGRTDYWELRWTETFWAEFMKHFDKIITNTFYFHNDQQNMPRAAQMSKYNMCQVKNARIGFVIVEEKSC